MNYGRFWDQVALFDSLFLSLLASSIHFHSDCRKLKVVSLASPKIQTLGLGYSKEHIDFPTKADVR